MDFNDRNPLLLIEGGGSLFRCAVATAASPVAIGASIPTTTPDETLGRVVAFAHERGVKPAAIGLACFGPLDIDSTSPTFGRMLSTPKEGWSGFDVVGFLRERLGAPVSFHTDVIGAALGEWKEGAARGARAVLYLTVGTGIGGGALVNGEPVAGRMHAELGHVTVRRDRGDRFPGVCPFHGDCLEGLASGPAIAKRALKKGENLKSDDPAIVRAMGYLAQAVANFVLTLAPDVVVIGGGVMRDGELLSLVRSRVFEILRTYVARYANDAAVEQLIVTPALGDRSSLVGAREFVIRGIVGQR